MYNNIKSKMGAQIFAVEHYKFVYSPVAGWGYITNYIGFFRDS